MDARVFVAGRSVRPNVPADWFVRAYNGGTGAILWTDEVDSGFNDAALAIAVDGTGVFVAGFISHPSGFHADFAVRAYDAQTGRLLWENKWDLASQFDSALAITAGGGRVVATGGGINTLGNEDVMIRGYDAQTGAILWTQVLNSGSDDEGEWVVLDKGRVFLAAVAGHIGSVCTLTMPPFFSGNCDFAVVAIDVSTGSVIWYDLFDFGSDFDGAFGIDVQGGRVIAAGIGTPPGSVCEADLGSGGPGVGGNCDFLVRAYDAGTGADLWTDVFDPAGGGYDLAFGVWTDASRAFVTGTAAHPGGICTNPFVAGGNCDFVIRVYDARNGSVIWQEQFDLAGGFDLAGQVAIHGSRIVVGARVQINAISGSDYARWQDCAVRAYDAGTGALLWTDQYDMPPSPDGHDRCGAAAAQGPRSFVAGRATNASGNLDFLVRAYNR